MAPKLNLTGALPLVILLGVVTAFDSMAIDMYLPAFPDMGRSLGADSGTMQTSLSIFLAALAVGQCFYGPLSDRFGRRLPLVAGIFLFSAASAVLALAENMTVFMIARCLQGLGAAAGLVIPRAIVADLYETRDAAKVFSLLMQIMMVSPIAAPPLGGALLTLLGWRSIFWVLAVIGLITAIALLKTAPSSPPPRTSGKGGVFLALLTYSALLRRRTFLAFTLCGALATAGLFVYIASSAFVFTEYFTLSPAVYSLVFAGNAVGAVLVGQVNILLLNRWTERQLLPVGLTVHALCTGLLLAVLLAGIDRLPVIAALIFLSIASLSLVFGNVTALTMACVSRHSGSASSLFGMVSYVFAAIAGGILGILHDGTLRPLAVAMLLCALGAILAWRIAMPAAAPKMPRPSA